MRTLPAGATSKQGPPAAPKGSAAGTWFLRTLTTIHALGSLVLTGMTLYLLGGDDRAEALARSPGARLMVRALGGWLPVFLASLAIFLGSLAWASHHRRPWAWGAAVVAYSIGILGSMWEVSVGIHQAWLSVLINAGVVAMLLSAPTRWAYLGTSSDPFPKSSP
ncbi:MAG: hypothetical protein ABIS67_13470 [Candidatus Eisenbacteria bacterium]